MMTLLDAWDWYDSAKTNLTRMRRLGSRHWNHKSLAGASIWWDDRFKEVEAGDIERETSVALRPLDDLGVLVLFSVFEAAVRDHLESVIKPKADALDDPILKHAAEQALEGIKQGSFANHVLTPLQNQHKITVGLCDRVRQVRDYRNWVAHGRRLPRDPDIVNLEPRVVFDRLREFLESLSIAAAPERQEPISDLPQSAGE